MEKELELQVELTRIEKEKKEHEQSLKTAEEQGEAYSLDNRKKMYMDMHKQRTDEEKKKNP